MSNYQEGMIVVVICLSVLVLALIGTIIYAITKIKEVHEDLQIERLKVQVLIDSVVEIFESKYHLYDDENEDRGGIPRRE